MAAAILPKWFKDLEDLLRCRICFADPGYSIDQCISGHQICDDCKEQLNVCPYCKKRWSSRNDLAESVYQKLCDIKGMLMIDPEEAKNKELIPCRAVELSTDTGEAPDRSQGLYPCRIDNCSSILSYELLLEHISVEHSDELDSNQLDDNNKSGYWSFLNAKQIISDHAFCIAGYGTFFARISLDEYGNLIGCVSVIDTAAASEKFCYDLRIIWRQHDLWYSDGQVQSCRTSREELAKKSRVVLPSILRPSIGDVLCCAVDVWRRRAEESSSSDPLPARPLVETVPAKRAKK